MSGALPDDLYVRWGGNSLQFLLMGRLSRMRQACAPLLVALLLMGSGSALAQPPLLDAAPQDTPMESFHPVADNVDLAWDYAHGGDLTRALGLLRQWEADAPMEAEYPFTSGSLLYTEGRLEEALGSFTRALELKPGGATALWARLYAADILLTQHRTGHAEKLLNEALRLEGSPRSIKFAANLRLRIRIRGELSEVNEFGDFTFYLSPYLVPVEDREPLYLQVEADWERAVRFLGLDPLAERPIIYLYPSDRLYAKYFPDGVDLVESSYAHQEVHLIYGQLDALQVLSPYALYLLQLEINRGGEGFYLVAPSIDEAIRGTTVSGIGLGAFCKAARAEGKLPPVESLVDPQNRGRIPPAIAEPAMGLLIRFLAEKLTPEVFRGVLGHPNFLGSLPRPLSSYQLDFERYLADQADLLEDPAAVAEGVEAIPDFAAIPIIVAGLEDELAEATRLYEAGDKAAALAAVDNLLAREPRYGEARYFRAKELYDKGQYKDARIELELVLRDTAPRSTAVGFSHFYLGRIAKLTQDYALASAHYGAAIAAGLPPERAIEAQGFKVAIDRFLAYGPIANAPPGPAPGPFFAALDQMLNGGTLQGAAVFSPQGDPVRLSMLGNYYATPAHLQYGAGWYHAVVGSSLEAMGFSLIEVEVHRVNADGSLAAGWHPERRRFRIATNGPSALILDYADESDIFETVSTGPSA